MTRVTARKGYCPNCESEQELERVRRRETVTVRGEKIRGIEQMRTIIAKSKEIGGL